jgi:hypothetical protein
MLNKTVCMACINAMKGRPIKDGYVVKGAPQDLIGFDSSLDKFRFAGWTDKDVMFWCEGIVKCRVIPAASCKIDGKPPRWCAYATEHAVCEEPKP